MWGGSGAVADPRVHLLFHRGLPLRGEASGRKGSSKKGGDSIFSFTLSAFGPPKAADSACLPPFNIGAIAQHFHGLLQVRGLLQDAAAAGCCSSPAASVRRCCCCSGSQLNTNLSGIRAGIMGAFMCMQCVPLQAPIVLCAPSGEAVRLLLQQGCCCVEAAAAARSRCRPAAAD